MRFGRRWGSGAERVGRVLVLVGGVVILVLVLLQWIGAAALWYSFMHMPRFYGVGSGLFASFGLFVGLICGVIAIVGSRNAGAFYGR